MKPWIQEMVTPVAVDSTTTSRIVMVPIDCTKQIREQEEKDKLKETKK